MRKENLWYPPSTPFVRLARAAIYGKWSPDVDIHDNEIQTMWLERIRRTGDTQQIERAERCLRNGWAFRCNLTGCPKCRFVRLIDPLHHINISEFQRWRALTIFIPVSESFDSLFRKLEHFRRLIRQKSKREGLKYEFRLSGFQVGYRAKWYESLVFNVDTPEDTLDSLLVWAYEVNKFDHARFHKWSGSSVSLVGRSIGKVTTIYGSGTSDETFRAIMSARLWAV